MVARLMSVWRQLATAVRRVPAGRPGFIGGADLDSTDYRLWRIAVVAIAGWILAPIHRLGLPGDTPMEQAGIGATEPRIQEIEGG